MMSGEAPSFTSLDVPLRRGSGGGTEAAPEISKAKRSDFRGIAILCGREQLVCASREAGGLCKAELERAARLVERLNRPKKSA